MQIKGGNELKSIFFMPNPNKQTLFFVLLCLYVADPATLLDFLWEQLVFSVMEKCLYLINIIKIQIPSLNFFSKITQCPFKLIFRLHKMSRIYLKKNNPQML